MCEIQILGIEYCALPKKEREVPMLRMVEHNYLKATAGH